MFYEPQSVSLELEVAEESARSALGVVLNDALDWIITLAEDDQTEFWAEVRDTLSRNETRSALETVVQEWRLTADALRDPLSRELLLADEFGPNDFQEVERPA
jgi:hypothetical protein